MFQYHGKEKLYNTANQRIFINGLVIKLTGNKASCIPYVKVFNYARLLDWTKCLRAYNYTHNA